MIFLVFFSFFSFFFFVLQIFCFRLISFGPLLDFFYSENLDMYLNLAWVLAKLGIE